MTSTVHTLPRMPPPDGGAWRWDDPKGRGTVVVPAQPACTYDRAVPGGIYQPCGTPGRQYASGWRCPSHAPQIHDR